MTSVLGKHRQRAKTGGRGQKPRPLMSRTQSPCLLCQGLTKLVEAFPPPALGMPGQQRGKAADGLLCSATVPSYPISDKPLQIQTVTGRSTASRTENENLTFTGSSLGAPFPCTSKAFLIQPSELSFQLGGGVLWFVGITGYIY